MIANGKPRRAAPLVVDFTHANHHILKRRTLFIPYFRRASCYDFFSLDFRQVLFKTRDRPAHAPANDRHSQLAAADFFDGFVSNHFALFNKEINWYDDERSVDFGYIKLHPDFWKNEDGNTFTTRSEVILPDLALPNSSTAYKVPRHLIFVDETDITVTRDPPELFFNVRETIDVYRKAWGVSEPRVWFLDDLTCLSAIFKAKKELVPLFRAEKNISQKLDMCRVAALYLAGGYQIAVDLVVKTPPPQPDDAGLVIAREGGVVSKRFIASEPKSGIMKATLDKMAEMSQQKQSRPDFNLLGEGLAQTLRGQIADSSVKPVFVPLETISVDVSKPWIITEMPAHSFDNPVPMEMRGPPSLEYKIPRRLIFYHSNLLETKDPPLLYENLQSSIKKYREAWGDPKAPVWVLNDTDCRSVIHAAKPTLLPYFDQEVHGLWKTNICRVAAVYLTGGYCFDVSTEIVSAWLPDHGVTFAAAADPDKTRYLQSFLASDPKGRIVAKALDVILLFYERRKLRRVGLLEPDTLKLAIESIPQSDRGKIVVLEEVHLIRPLNTECCNFVVQDPATNQTLFYSRVSGYG
jgi:hypothetical protein